MLLGLSHPLAPHAYHSLSDPFVLLCPVPACPAPASPWLLSAPVHSSCSRAQHCPQTHCPEATWFSFSFTVIYLHGEKQLSSKKSYLSQRSGFIFPSITLHFLLLLLHFFFSFFCPRQAQLCVSHGANKLGTRAL